MQRKTKWGKTSIKPGLVAYASKAGCPERVEVLSVTPDAEWVHLATPDRRWHCKRKTFLANYRPTPVEDTPDITIPKGFV